MDGFAFTPQHKIHSAFKVNYVTISSLAPIHLFFLTVPAAPSRREARTERPRRGERNRGLSAVLRRAGPGRAPPRSAPAESSASTPARGRPAPPRAALAWNGLLRPAERSVSVAAAPDPRKARRERGRLPSCICPAQPAPCPPPLPPRETPLSAGDVPTATRQRSGSFRAS